ncbi:hypothetical protein Droror1_Dr00008279 [Drosera rotundifolia]
MVIIGLPNPNKTMLKKLNHSKPDSDDLAVFEATRYYSGELKRHNPNQITSQTKPKEDYKHQVVPNEYIPEANQVIISKEKKPKQPGSPGGRLANLLNSIFVSQKIKTTAKNPSLPRKSSTKDRGDDEKKRTSKARTNIGQLWNTKTVASKSPLPPTPRKTMPSGFFKNKSKSSNEESHVKANGEGRTETESMLFDWLDERSKCSSSSTNGLSSETPTAKDSDVGKGCNEIFGMVDDGWDSDSSSDLFELEIGREMGFCYSNDLPVFESTQVGCVARTELDMM